MLIVRNRLLTDQALKAWETEKEIYQQEIARTTFLKSRVKREQGDSDTAEQLAKEAAAMRAKLPRAEPKAY